MPSRIPDELEATLDVVAGIPRSVVIKTCIPFVPGADQRIGERTWSRHVHFSRSIWALEECLRSIEERIMEGGRKAYKSIY